jgi:hypothetical protein
MFAVFCFVLVPIALISFWPPKTPSVGAWLLLWIAVCLATGIAILRRAWYAPTLVWTLNILAGLRAAAAIHRGRLRGVGILIELLLFVPLVWFAIWYQRRRSAESATAGSLGPPE